MHGPLTFSKPIRIVAAYRAEEVLPALREVEVAVSKGLYAAGFVSYEAAPAFDEAMRTAPASGLPLVWFGLFSSPMTEEKRETGGDFTISDWEPSLSEARFAQHIGQIREAIGAGDCYQVNHTMRLRAAFTGSDLSWYRQLLAAQKPGFGAYMNLGRYRILSVSPELFFRREGDRIVTRPMKGTMPRGRWSEEDYAHARALEMSEKDRAENIMIVDLLRNDLGRLAIPGTVKAERLFAVERYPTLLQMTSTVSAALRPGTSLADIFTALFPCGSVTGAPKISAMARIAALEPDPRQIYCGAIGYLTPGGLSVFSVAIRTVLLDSATGMAEYGVGSGITWDSTSEGEFAEGMLKAEVLTARQPDFELLETLRLEEGGCFLLERHIERISASARYFNIPLSEQTIRDALDEIADYHSAGVWRLRLLADMRGLVRVESQPFVESSGKIIRAAVARTPVSRNDRFLFHKTTHRAVYDARRAERADAAEVLLWNEEGELTEFTTGNLVLELSGGLFTPPLDCGLLPGTLRAELLAGKEIEERVLRLLDLDAASGIWLINSVRGWVTVVPVD